MPVSLYCLASFNPHLSWNQVCEPFMKLSASFSITWVQWVYPELQKTSICVFFVWEVSAQLHNQTYFCDDLLIHDRVPPSRRTKSRISYREHTELVDESISPEGISTKTIPAVGEVLKLDLLLTVSCRCLNKNRYDTLLGCLEKIDIMDIR